MRYISFVKVSNVIIGALFEAKNRHLSMFSHDQTITHQKFSWPEHIVVRRRIAISMPELSGQLNLTFLPPLSTVPILTSTKPTYKSASCYPIRDHEVQASTSDNVDIVVKVSFS